MPGLRDYATGADTLKPARRPSLSDYAAGQETDRLPVQRPIGRLSGDRQGTDVGPDIDRIAPMGAVQPVQAPIRERFGVRPFQAGASPRSALAEPITGLRAAVGEASQYYMEQAEDMNKEIESLVGRPRSPYQVGPKTPEEEKYENLNTLQQIGSDVARTGGRAVTGALGFMTGFPGRVISPETFAPEAEQPLVEVLKEEGTGLRQMMSDLVPQVDYILRNRLFGISDPSRYVDPNSPVEQLMTMLTGEEFDQEAYQAAISRFYEAPESPLFATLIGKGVGKAVTSRFRNGETKGRTTAEPSPSESLADIYSEEVQKRTARVKEPITPVERVDHPVEVPPSPRLERPITPEKAEVVRSESGIKPKIAETVQIQPEKAPVEPFKPKPAATTAGPRKATPEEIEAARAFRGGKKKTTTPEGTPVADAALASRLRKAAGTARVKAGEMSKPGIEAERPTAKRLREASGRLANAEWETKVSQALDGLANHAEAGTTPEALRGITSRIQAELLLSRAADPRPFVRKDDIRDMFKGAEGKKGVAPIREELRGYQDIGREHGFDATDAQVEAIKTLQKITDDKMASWSSTLDQLRQYDRLKRAGVTTKEQWQKAHDALNELTVKKSPAEIKAAERELKRKEMSIQKEPGFFVTPDAVAKDMIDRANIEKGDAVLEPSAGLGNIADLLPKDQTKVIEFSHQRQEFLKESGHDVVGGDFLEHTGKYDKIVMNPPFEKGAEINHVRHAYELLNPGGKIVSIMSEGPFGRGDKKATGFREWLDEVGGTSEKLPEKSFQGSGTGVNVRLVEIEKSGRKAEAAPKTEPAPVAETPKEAVAEAPKEIATVNIERTPGNTPEGIRDFKKKMLEEIDKLETENDISFAEFKTEFPEAKHMIPRLKEDVVINFPTVTFTFKAGADLAELQKQIKRLKPQTKIGTDAAIRRGVADTRVPQPFTGRIRGAGPVKEKTLKEGLADGTVTFKAGPAAGAVAVTTAAAALADDEDGAELAGIGALLGAVVGRGRLRVNRITRALKPGRPGLRGTRRVKRAKVVSEALDVQTAKSNFGTAEERAALYPLVAESTKKDGKFLPASDAQLAEFAQATPEQFGKLTAAEKSRVRRQYSNERRKQRNAERLDEYNRKEFNIEPDPELRKKLAEPPPEAPSIENVRDINRAEKALKDPDRNFEKALPNELAETLIEKRDAAKQEYTDFILRGLEQHKEVVEGRIGIRPGSKIDRAVQEFGERKKSWKQIQKEFGPENSLKIVKAASWYRKKYEDLLKLYNKTMANLFPGDKSKLIERRQNYFRHFRDLGNLGRLLDIVEEPGGMMGAPVRILRFMKPATKKLSIIRERLGRKTDLSAAGGYVDYIQQAGYGVHINPMVNYMRQFGRNLDKAYMETNTAPIFRDWYNNWVDNMAGKPDAIDAWFHSHLGKGWDVMNVLNQRAKQNIILGNASSVLAQAYNIPQAIGSMLAPNFARGVRRTLADIFLKREEYPSRFIRERYLESKFSKYRFGMVNKARNTAAWFMREADRVSTIMIRNGFLEQALKEGKKNPGVWADRMARKHVAGRGIGELPNLQRTKIFQMIAPFQVEVGGAMWAFIDLHKGEKKFSKVATFMVAAYVMNRFAEEIRGNPVSFDPIQALIEGMQIAADERRSRTERLIAIPGRLAGEMLSNIPLGQTAAALYPEYGGTFPGTDFKLPTRKKVFGTNDPTRFGSTMLTVDAIHDWPERLLLPFGGVQAKKTLGGVGAIQDKKVTIHRKDIRIAATKANAVRALLFGKYSIPEVRAYFDRRERGTDEVFRKKVVREAKDLIKKGDTKKAGEVLDRWREIRPNQSVPTMPELIRQNMKNIKRNVKRNLYDRP